MSEVEAHELKRMLSLIAMEAGNNWPCRELATGRLALLFALDSVGAPENLDAEDHVY